MSHLQVARASVPVPKPGSPWTKYTILAVATTSTAGALLAADVWSQHMHLPMVVEHFLLMAAVGALMFYAVCRAECRVRAGQQEILNAIARIEYKVDISHEHGKQRTKDVSYAEGFVDGIRGTPAPTEATVRLIRPGRTG